MPTEKATICVCARCGHKWLPRTVVPARCSGCKSPIWNRKAKNAGRPPSVRFANPGMLDLDASTFQKQLDELANTIAFKVQREGHKRIKPVFTAPDIYYLLRYAHQTYNLFCFVNADERRQKDVDYRIPYSIVILPLVRTMIDCLYNVCAMLSNPGPKGYQFRESGLKRMLEAVEADEQKYRGDPRWEDWIGKYREFVERDMKNTGITSEDLKTVEDWPTLGRYVNPDRNPQLADHQQFLRKFTLGFWREYSGMSHAMFQGLAPIASYLAPKDLAHELRPVMDEGVERIVALHISRVAGILLCMLTEVQAYFRFDREQSARIDQRLHEVWCALTPLPEIKELYDGRYCKLMTDRGISP